jgi:hypothetical protein
LAAAVVFVAAAVVAACSSHDAPQSHAEAQLSWVVSTINDGSAQSADVTDHFTPDFLAQDSASALTDAFLRIHQQQAPLAIMGDDLPATDTTLLKKATDVNKRWLRIALATEDAAPYRMSNLNVAPNGDLDPALQTWSDVLAAMNTAAPSVSFLSASLAPTGCAAQEEIGSSSELSIGSNLKLYILSALTKDVAAGKRAWTDTIAIRDDWKSLSPLEFDAVGTTHTLKDLAERMITQSDNTAADHLLFTLGRTTVEAEVTAAGHSKPALLTPFLATWDWFWLVLLATPAQQSQFVAANEADRRTILGTIPRTSSDRDAANAALASFTTPRLFDSVGWFASAKDLCAVVARIQSLGGGGFDVLLESHGLPDLRGDFTALGYKAGSEPGVLSTSYALERSSDGAWFFLGMILNDTTATFDRDNAFYVLGAARGLIARGASH